MPSSRGLHRGLLLNMTDKAADGHEQEKKQDETWDKGKTTVSHYWTTFCYSTIVTQRYNTL